MSIQVPLAVLDAMDAKGGEQTKGPQTKKASRQKGRKTQTKGPQTNVTVRSRTGLGLQTSRIRTWARLYSKIGKQVFQILTQTVVND